MERKRRNKQVNRDLAVPILDVAQLGTANDPCYGLHYDLAAEECNACGDIEGCSIVFLRQLQIRRLKAENQDSNLDLQIDRLERDRQIEDYITDRQARGLKRTLIVSRARKRFRIPKEQILEIYNKLNDGH